jgi:hypothetical protein
LINIAINGIYTEFAPLSLGASHRLHLRCQYLRKHPINQNKFAAEQQLTTYFFRLPISDYPLLFEEASENVLLAYSAILLKNIGALGDHLREITLKINQIIMKWYQTSGIFQRGSGIVLKKYVENTFGQFMGNCLKILYQRDETKKWVDEFL